MRLYSFHSLDRLERSGPISMLDLDEGISASIVIAAVTYTGADLLSYRYQIFGNSLESMLFLFRAVRFHRRRAVLFRQLLTIDASARSRPLARGTQSFHLPLKCRFPNLSN